MLSPAPARAGCRTGGRSRCRASRVGAPRCRCWPLSATGTRNWRALWPRRPSPRSRLGVGDVLVVKAERGNGEPEVVGRGDRAGRPAAAHPVLFATAPPPAWRRPASRRPSGRPPCRPPASRPGSSVVFFGGQQGHLVRGLLATASGARPRRRLHPLHADLLGGAGGGRLQSGEPIPTRNCAPKTTRANDTSKGKPAHRRRLLNLRRSDLLPMYPLQSSHVRKSCTRFPSLLRRRNMRAILSALFAKR